MLDTVETDEMLVIPWKRDYSMTSRCCARKFNFWRFQQVEKLTMRKQQQPTLFLCSNNSTTGVSPINSSLYRINKLLNITPE